jgi:hypothetical protein
MKVAVLLTGQLRTFEMVKHLHMNSLILQYNADVFLGIDVSNKYQCVYENSTNKTNTTIVNNAINFFNPIDTFILDDFTDEFNNIITSKFNKYNKINLSSYKCCFRQYYVVKNTYKMLINHINKGNNYDLIIRLRFDQFIFSNEVPINPQIYDNVSNKILYNENNINILNNYTKDKKFIFDEVNDNTIHVFGFGDYKHYKIANDQFFFHNQSILIQMFEFYDNILPLLNYCYENNIGNLHAWIECIFYLYITNNNINLKKSNIYGIFVRELN